MSDNLDEFEELLLGEERRNYSAQAIDHAMNPRNLGAMENADVYANITGPCGDTIEIWLKIDDNIISKATYMTDGCGTSIAAGSMVTELATGKNHNRSYGNQPARMCWMPWTGCRRRASTVPF